MAKHNIGDTLNTQAVGVCIVIGQYLIQQSHPEAEEKLSRVVYAVLCVENNQIFLFEEKELE